MTELTDLLQRHVAQGTAPGIVAALGDASGALESAAAGALAEDAIVRIQSMTKPVLAVATLRLVARGTLGLDDPVARWLPELASPQVLRSPGAEVDDTVPAERPITVRHLLTCTSGYGMILDDSPLQQAMADAGVEAGPEPVTLGADAWLTALAGLPLVAQPGQTWRYHHSFGLLGILLSRVVGGSLEEHLRGSIFVPLGMTDTGYAAPTAEAHRLPAAYRRQDGEFTQVEPPAAGYYVRDETADRSHGELVSTVADYAAFARMLSAGGVHAGEEIVEPELLALLRTDQVPASAKDSASSFPGFWDSSGWGFGVAVELDGERAGRYGWSGGLGTDVWVDPRTGRYGVLLTQVEMGPAAFALMADLQALAMDG